MVSRTSKKCAILLGIAAVTLNLIPSSAKSHFASECEALKTADFSTLQDAPTQIAAADLIQAQGDVPAYCDVRGQVAPQVGFEMRLPTENWNGKFLMVGCGGMCGEPYTDSCNRPLRKGYACIGSDMGHTGVSRHKGLWAYNNLQAEVDFAFRATHVTALAGKALTERYYQVKPEKSYFMGCSQGGRQGLVAAQRFPWDFDGIIAGAPAIPYDGQFMNMLWAVGILAAGVDGHLALPPSAIQRIHEAVLVKCDLDDGVKDGIVGNPPACQFDPSELICKAGQKLSCLTPTQADMVKRLYAGVITSSGVRLHPGLAVGSELRWTNEGQRWEHIKELAAEGFRYKFFVPDPGPSWQPEDFDFDRDYKRLHMMESLYSGSNPDLRRFKAAGGRLIVYHGWNDEWLMPQPVVDYYETVERTMGGRKPTQDFFRLFMLPGVNHCWGGAGADAVDFLGALEAWVERGQPPNRLLSAHIESEAGFPYPYREPSIKAGEASFTRPLYPYPQRSMYRGKGDPDDAANFRSVEP